MRDMVMVLPLPNQHETVQHVFFDCPFTKGIWLETFTAFHWSVALPNDTQSWLRSLFIDLPFKATKERLWICIICSVLWKIWDESNARIC